MVCTNILYTSLSRREVRTSVKADEACLLSDSKLNSIVRLFNSEGKRAGFVCEVM